IWSIGAILSEMITGQILFEPILPADEHFKKYPVLKAISICGPVPDVVLREDIDDESGRVALRKRSAVAVRIDFLQHFVQNGRSWLQEEITSTAEHLLSFIDRTLSLDHGERLRVDEALAHPFLADVRVPSKEVVANHSMSDIGDLEVEEWKHKIWEVIKESPVRL
ncbi:hypothetical protein PMAYCL1PPCAC_31429, partial [Pristionchus mayeri]